MIVEVYLDSSGEWERVDGQEKVYLCPNHIWPYQFVEVQNLPFKLCNCHGDHQANGK